MSPENFCYWLQGMFELTNTKNLTEDQVEVIREHLKLVFTKVTNKSVLPLRDSTLEGIIKDIEGERYNLPDRPLVVTC